MASSQNHQLHFIMFPLMAQGHMNPMLDMARLFAHRGVVVTIVTTPLNLPRFKTTVDRAIEANLPIRILQLQFPSVEAGLPEGCEHFDSLPSPEFVGNFFVAAGMLQQPLEESLRELEPVPSCIISDFCFPWTSETAQKFRIPRIIFPGINCFSLLCSHNALLHKAYENVKSASDPFIIPGLPDRIEVTKAQLPGSISKGSTDMTKIHRQFREAEASAYGVVVNTFDDLETRYIEEYKKAKHQKIWCVGPVSLCNKNMSDKFERGNKATIAENHCLEWLDSREPNSVVYVCLGSLCRLIPSQLKEIGLGLEATGRPFIWVIKGCENYSELENWLNTEGYKERTKDRGLIVSGWAPQVLILSHQAVAGFLTHCGWNSTLESVSAGVPMITWPMFAEQFLNEKLIVQVLGIGIKVGIDIPVLWGEEEKFGVLVKKEVVEMAVNKLLDETEEGEARRRKAKELREVARRAMEEGGSSHMNMTLLIQHEHDIVDPRYHATSHRETLCSRRTRLLSLNFFSNERFWI